MANSRGVHVFRLHGRRLILIIQPHCRAVSFPGTIDGRIPRAGALSLSALDVKTAGTEISGYKSLHFS
jgi:hypothetical protein